MNELIRHVFGIDAEENRAEGSVWEQLIHNWSCKLWPSVDPAKFGVAVESQQIVSKDFGCKTSERKVQSHVQHCSCANKPYFRACWRSNGCVQ